MGIIQRFKRARNAFLEKDSNNIEFDPFSTGIGSARRPDVVTLNPYNGRSIMAPVLNRIAIDVSAVAIQHVKVDEEGRFTETVNDKLNDIFTFEANKDQTGQAFIRDIVMSMLDEGNVAAVPIDTDVNFWDTDAYTILSARVGKIVEWMPEHIRVNVYNDRLGQFEELVFPKRVACIFENPFYTVMNEPNSTLQRLVRTLNYLDEVNAKNNSGKLDIIIQLPYTVKTDMKREMAEKRRKDLTDQLANSQYGIAYLDGTERITQLNRPAENNLVSQAKELTEDFYNQLGMTSNVFYGTASEQEMLNYENRTIKPILKALTDEMRRKWISVTARGQGHSIMAISNPFNYSTASSIADMADKFTRNEILSTNEVRVQIGYKPSNQEGADELRNKNLNAPEEDKAANETPPEEGTESVLDSLV